MAKELAFIYSKVLNLALETTIISFLDPLTLSKNDILQNTAKAIQLSKNMIPLLHRQNNLQATALCIELEHLLQNVTSALKHLSNCMSAAKNQHDFFSMVHLTEQCNFHIDLYMMFKNNCKIQYSLALINDVEKLFRCINSVFYCMDALDALESIQEASTFLGSIRGTSPIPCPNLYNTNKPCMYCFQEAALLPNQGKNIHSSLINKPCCHVTQPITPEPVTGLFEEELVQLGIPISKPSLLNHNVPPKNQCDTLKLYDIFQSHSSNIFEISTLLYWTSNLPSSEVQHHALGSAMATLLANESCLNACRQSLPGKQLSNNHFFDVFRPNYFEFLFTGSIFFNSNDILQSLKKDCSATFFQSLQNQGTFSKHHELYSRLQSLLTGSDVSAGLHLENPHASQPPQRPLMGHNSFQTDAETRKTNYFKRVSNDGFKRLTDCLEANTDTLYNLLCLKQWGHIPYTMLATLKNHFIFRKQFIEQEWLQPTPFTHQIAFENAKYIKNTLFSNCLDPEHIGILTMKFYQLITGPISLVDDLFPISSNIILGHCLDAAHTMPHQKLLVTELIWPSIQPSDWITSNFNEFLQVKTSYLSSIQHEIWCFIREAVLSVALYNKIWHKQLKLHSLVTLPGPHINKLGCHYSNGLYITYESVAPIILVHNGLGWIFKDLYSLLYHHMQLTC